MDDFICCIVSKTIVPQASNPAKNDIPSVEWLATEVSGKIYIHCCKLYFIYIIIDSQGYHDGILNSIAPDFTAKVNMDTLLPYLQKHLLVTRDEEYCLSNIMYRSSKKAQMLLGYLKTKKHGSLQLILCCLNSAHEHIGHKEVADKLKQIMEAKNIKCADFCSDHCSDIIKISRLMVVFILESEAEVPLTSHPAARGGWTRYKRYSK